MTLSHPKYSVVPRAAITLCMALQGAPEVRQVEMTGREACRWGGTNQRQIFVTQYVFLFK